MSSIVIYIALRSMANYKKKILFDENHSVKLCLQFWYTMKILVPNQEIVVAIHHLEIFFVSIYSKTILFY